MNMKNKLRPYPPEKKVRKKNEGKSGDDEKSSRGEKFGKFMRKF
jgi:hypothetical protein